MGSRRNEWEESVEWLLTEAFVSDVPVTDFQQATGASRSFGDPFAVDPWPATTSVGDAKQLFLKQLVEVAPRLQEERKPKPYYLRRTAAVTMQDAVDGPGVQREWVTAVRNLQRSGYLHRVAPDPCEDGEYSGAFPDQVLDEVVAERLGRRGLWSPLPESWDEPTFYSLVEVFHDLVARPRRRWFHSWNSCGWHYENFAVAPAQMLYRWTVNRLLSRAGVGLQIAKSGEDVGRLVHSIDDGRQSLVTAVFETPDPDRKSSLEHAVALYRSRASGKPEKRSACVVLAGLLEERRELLEQNLLSKDEGALFTIANKFAIRHRRADQMGDYDEPYLDWIFWWYLATIELTDKMLARQLDPTALDTN